MKARKLKKLFKKLDYDVCNTKKYICIGTPLCSDLITVNKQTLKIKYALDTFNEGRKALEETPQRSENSKLLFIWNTLQKLIDSGEIKDIIEGNDILKNPIPIYFVDNGEVIETFTDTKTIAPPNITISGELLYSYVYFKTKQEAVNVAITDYNKSLVLLQDRKDEYQHKISEIDTLMQQLNEGIQKLKAVVS